MSVHWRIEVFDESTTQQPAISTQKLKNVLKCNLSLRTVRLPACRTSCSKCAHYTKERIFIERVTHTEMSVNNLWTVERLFRHSWDCKLWMRFPLKVLKKLPNNVSANVRQRRSLEVQNIIVLWLPEIVYGNIENLSEKSSLQTEKTRARQGHTRFAIVYVRLTFVLCRNTDEGDQRFLRFSWNSAAKKALKKTIS